jgi:undecaprenyl-diphosphatase
MLHFGTLLALAAYFWADLKAMLANLLGSGSNRLLLRVIISTIPAVIAGLMFEELFSGGVRNIGIVTLMLFLVGLLMIMSDRLFAQSKMDSSEMTKTEALFIGIAQSIALIPGTSRSGITMLAARSQGMSNQAAANYSFLIGIPIIFGATMRVIFKDDTRQYIGENIWQTGLGVALAAVAGWFVLRLLIPFVAKHGLAIFGWYRLALASVLFIIWLNN